MKKRHKYIPFFLAGLCFGGILTAQTPTEEFLLRVAEHSFYIEAGRGEADARIAASRRENAPPDPEVTYGYMPGIEQTDTRRQSYGISQGIAWPGEYAARSKYNKLERQQAEVEFQGERQEFLLRTKLLCYELVHAQKRQNILDFQQANSENILAMTEKRFEHGEATSIDVSNARLSLINANAAWLEGKSVIETKRKQLALLAGFDDFDTQGFDYTENPQEDPKELFDQAYAAAAAVRTAELESNKSAHNVGIQRGTTLPSFSIGVAGERISPTDSFLGVSAGVSIPLWGGSGKVKAAKAEKHAAELRSLTIRTDAEAELSELANSVEQLRESLTQYEALREINQATLLLNKSFEQKQISVLDYFTNLSLYKDIEEEYLDREFRFYEALAKLNKFRL